MVYFPLEDPEGARSLEEWLDIRNSNNRSALSDWEKDDDFLEFALRKYPRDMASVGRGGYQSQTARQSLRLRHESFSALLKEQKKERDDATQ